MEQRGQYFYVEYGSLRVRWDEACLWDVTLDEPLRSGARDIKGMCGNFNGNPNGQLTICSEKATWKPGNM